MSALRLRFPLGTQIWTRWICKGEIDGLIEARVVFRREPHADELIAFDEFELLAGPGDYVDGAYRIAGVPPRHLTPGTYRPVGARVRVSRHEQPFDVDLSRYSSDFAIVLYDDSPLAAPV